MVHRVDILDGLKEPTFWLSGTRFVPYYVAKRIPELASETQGNGWTTFPERLRKSMQNAANSDDKSTKNKISPADLV